MFEGHKSFHFSETSGQSSSPKVLDPYKRMSQERRQLNSQTKEIQEEKESIDEQLKGKLDFLARESQNKKRKDLRDDDSVSTGKHSRDEIEHNIKNLEKLKKELQEEFRKKKNDHKVITNLYNESMGYINTFKAIYDHYKSKTGVLDSKCDSFAKDVSNKNLHDKGEEILQFIKHHKEIQRLEQVKKVLKQFNEVHKLQTLIQNSITLRELVTSNDRQSLLQTKTKLKGAIDKEFSSHEIGISTQSEPLNELHNKLSEYLELLNPDYFGAVAKASDNFSTLSKLRDEQKAAENNFIKVQEEREGWIKESQELLEKHNHAINEIKKQIGFVQQKLTVLKSELKATTSAQSSQQEIKVPTESLEDHLWSMFAQVDLSKIKSNPASEHKATKSSSTNENRAEFSGLDDIVDHGKESHAHTNNEENSTGELMELLQVLRARGRAKAHDGQDKASQIKQSFEANNREDETVPLIQLQHAQDKQEPWGPWLKRNGERLWDIILKMGGR